MDRLDDMYFYIARGINLLAQGESIIAIIRTFATP